MLSEHSTIILSNDNEASIQKRLENIVVKYGFLKAVNNYKMNKIVKLEIGKYWPTLSNKWEEINPKDFSSTFLINLNKAKQSYGGYKVFGKKYKYCKLKFDNIKNKFEDVVQLEVLNGKLVTFYNDK